MKAFTLARVLMTATTVVSSSLLSSAARGAPVGSEFRVNSHTAGTQWGNALVAGNNGDVLATWMDLARGSGTFMQRYDQAGTPLLTQDQLLGVGLADVGLDGGGNVVALRTAPDGAGNGVYAAVYDRAGNVRVAEFRVNSATNGEQNAPRLAVNAKGDFVVAWTSDASGTPAVYIKRFRANGVAVSLEALASSPTAGLQSTMDIGIDASGNSVVTWYSLTQSSPPVQYDVWARAFNSAGVARGAPFRANTYMPGAQIGNKIAMNSTGEFVIVWESYGQASGTWDIYAQRYTATGVRVNAEFLVNTLLVGEQQAADVALMDDGSFAIAWQTDNRWADPNSLPTIYLRQYATNGIPTDAEQVVSSSPTGRAFQPYLALDRAGNLTVTWRQFDTTTGDIDIYGRRYEMDTLPLITQLASGQSVNGISGENGSFAHHRLDVPPGATTIQIAMTGSDLGDADLHVRFAGLPTVNVWDVRPFLTGSNEGVVITNVPPGQWFIGINAYASYANVSLTATYR